MLDVEVLLPVHNEGESLESTVREIHQEISAHLRMGFIICEDGSKDNTKEVATRLAVSIPMQLNLSDERKGYSRAVREGMALLESDFLLCLDSDGQCDPRDFWTFWNLRDQYDIVIGWRTHRADNFVRRLFSRIFYRFYRIFFPVSVHDPSCPFVLMRRDVAKRLEAELGLMQQGFWWEFVARAYRRGYSIKECPIHHRRRSAGVTQVYKWQKMPGIFLRHVGALFQIWSQTRHNARSSA